MGMTLKILIVTLFFNAVEARPISYSGGHTIMHFNDNMKESLYYHYSPSYKYSFGIENLNDKIFCINFKSFIFENSLIIL